KIDTRDFTFSRAANNFAAAATVSNNLPGNHRVNVNRINPFTGSTENLESANAPTAFSAMPGQGPANAALITLALDHVQAVAPALGFSPTEKPEFVPDPYVKETSAGTRVVNLQQQYHGIRVVQMERGVWFEKDGTIRNVTGINVSLPTELEILPTVSLEEAAKAAAAYMASPTGGRDAWTRESLPQINIDVTNYRPEILGRVAIPAQPAVLSKGPFGENVPMHLVFFYQGPTTRLGWHSVISTPNLEEQYVVIVEAHAQTQPQILYGQKVSNNMSNARGNVWTHNPGVLPQREMVDFPRPLIDYPIDSGSVHLPDELFPRPWVDAGPMAIGNSTVAVSGNSMNSVNGVPGANVLIFDPAQPQGDDQKVVNIFYFCNYMHDFF